MAYVNRVNPIRLPSFDSCLLLSLFACRFVPLILKITQLFLKQVNRTFSKGINNN